MACVDVGRGLQEVLLDDVEAGHALGMKLVAGFWPPLATLSTIDWRSTARASALRTSTLSERLGLDVEAHVVDAQHREDCTYSGSALRRSMSAIGRSYWMSISPFSKAATPVVASLIITILIVFRVTDAASRQSAHFSRVRSESWVQVVSLYGPLVTMLAGSVHLSPNWSTTFFGIGK